MYISIIRKILFFLCIAGNFTSIAGISSTTSKVDWADPPAQQTCDLNVAHNYTSVVQHSEKVTHKNILDQVNMVGAGAERYGNVEHPKTMRRFSFTQHNREKESLNCISSHENKNNPLARHIHQVTDNIISNHKFVDQLTPETVVDLPVGIRKTIMGIDYILAVDSIVITPTHAYLAACMSLDIPQVGKLAFAGKEILFTQTGGFSGDVILQLIEAPNIPFGSEVSLELLTEKTFAVFDCKGFKHLGVGGEFTFSRNLLIPENDSVTYVKANFEAPMLSNWNDLVIDISFDSFQINGLKDFTFIAEKAVLDFSDLKNPAGLDLPKTIASYYDSEINLWRGFSLQKLTVKLPSQFKKDESKGRIEITVYDLLIDETGFTGNISMDNILSINDGRMGNWAFSVDQLHVHIQSNQFISAGLDGQVLVPLFSKDLNEGAPNESSLTQYKAIINPGGEYLFSMSLNEMNDIPLWNAKATIYSSSFIDVKIADGEFQPKACLNGKLSIKTEDINIPEIEFERLMVTSESPYLSLGYIGLGKEDFMNVLSNFPVQLKNISSVCKDDGKLQLDFDLILNLVKESDGGFGAEGSFSVYGHSYESNGLLSFKYEETVIKKISVDIDGGGFKLQGFVEHFENNKVYGKGYHGKLMAEFKPGLELSAYALFGSMNEFRYWFADAMFATASGIPVFPGLNIYGFGGGAYYHMGQTSDESSNQNPLIGKSISGIRYVPDKNINLGIKASVNMGSPSKEAFNANVTFEIVFNQNGGLDRISFNGTAAVMTPPLELTESKIMDRFSNVVNNENNQGIELEKLKQSGAIHAGVKIDFDFENECLHGDFKVYANLADGLIRGTGPNDLAGSAIIHFSNDEWYLHIGHPDKSKRIGLEFIGVARFDSYFMIGDNIPGSPSPPEKVSEIIGDIDLNYMSELNALGEGSGFAFGASLELSTGERTFLVFYGSFDAGLGFDVMLKDYGDNVRCSGSDDPIGINGWYANGQAYAYFDGEIGVNVDLPFKSGKFKILSIGAAAVLQAKLPNPLWMKGIVGGNYNILGGLVKGKCAFEIVIGEDCKLIQSGSAVANLDIISDLTPKNNEENVNVFSAPQVIFNMPVDREFEITEMDGLVKKYRIKLDHLQVTEENVDIYGDLEWNSMHDVVAFNSSEILPPNTEIKLFVRVSFEEYQNGDWITVFYENEKVIEEKEIIFTTGEAPDYIPESNVLYSYPLNQQYNLYSDESSNGFIQLIKGQGYLFSDPGWKVNAVFHCQKEIVNELKYDYQKKQVTFNIPSDLEREYVYNLEILSKPINSEYEIDQNVKMRKTFSKDQSNSDNSLEITEKYAEQNLDIVQDKIIYNIRFKTSKHATLKDKLKQMQKYAEWVYPIYTGIHELGYSATTTEVFDKFEITGSNNIAPLIQIEAQLDNNFFYNNEIFPLVYMDYPIENKFFITNRNANNLGVPPIYANYIEQDQSNVKLSPDHKLFEIKNTKPTELSFIYNLMYYYNQDLYDLQSQILNDLVNGGLGSDRKGYIINSVLPVIKKGDYEVIIKYVLPNGIITSKNALVIHNPVNFRDNL